MADACQLFNWPLPMVLSGQSLTSQKKRLERQLSDQQLIGLIVLVDFVQCNSSYGKQQ
jgi:hypothetical protein